ncbi:hypothetical protein DFS33DRAFT_1311146 [Desarmillaria ectypa]|nr:hypothetical protein DFS33DRAFT_1311146 [Desarmillaria ectypa]
MGNKYDESVRDFTDQRCRWWTRGTRDVDKKKENVISRYRSKSQGSRLFKREISEGIGRKDSCGSCDSVIFVPNAELHMPCSRCHLYPTTPPMVYPRQKEARSPWLAQLSLPCHVSQSSMKFVAYCKAIIQHEIKLHCSSCKRRFSSLPICIRSAAWSALGNHPYIFRPIHHLYLVSGEGEN